MDTPSRVRGSMRSTVYRHLLDYEAQRLDFDIITRDCWAREITPVAFEPHALLCVSRAGASQSIEIELDGQPVTLPAVVPSVEDHELLEVHGQVLGRVAGRELHLFVDLDALFERPDQLDVEEPNRVVRRLFEALVPQGLEMVRRHIDQYNFAQERQQFVRSKLDGMDSQQSRARDDLRINEGELADAARRVERLARACAELRRDIQVYEETTRPALRRQAEQEFDGLRRMTPEPFENLQVDQGRIKLFTTPVTLTDGDLECDLGQFLIEISLSDFRLRILPWRDNRRIDDYYHPHLSTDGIPCWGNIGPAVLELLGERDLSGVLPVIWQFLSTYFSGNPYIPLARWSSEYDPDAVFEECFADADPLFDCIHCSRRQCPFWESRFSRCWEQIQADSDWQTCAEGCRRCNFANEARRRLEAEAEAEPIID